MYQRGDFGQVARALRVLDQLRGFKLDAPRWYRRAMRLVGIAFLAVGSLALADKPLDRDKIANGLQNALWSLPETHYKVAPFFAFDRAHTYPMRTETLGDEVFSTSGPPLVALAIDGESAWVAAEVAIPFPGQRAPDDAHVTGLVDGDASGPLFIHLGAYDAASLPPNAPLPAIARKVDAGASDAVKRFETTLGDPKAFAASISDRNDVVLFGSDAKERFVGGEKARAGLRSWGLALTLRDGITAGTTTSKTVVWLAANVDARPAGKPKAAATPYRVTAIYEHHGATWDIVQLHFSFVRS